MAQKTLIHISDEPKLALEFVGECAVIHQNDPLRGDEGMVNRVYLEPWEARELINALREFAA